LALERCKIAEQNWTSQSRKMLRFWNKSDLAIKGSACQENEGKARVFFCQKSPNPTPCLANSVLHLPLKPKSDSIQL
jgi:hypothetical protein